MTPLEIRAVTKLLDSFVPDMDEDGPYCRFCGDHFSLDSYDGERALCTTCEAFLEQGDEDD